MPILDRNKIVVTCDFDDNIVVVGGSIRGTVNIYVLQPVTLCGASLRYHIDESYVLFERDQSPTNASLNKVSFNIEYVLFGHRSTRKSAPLSVGVGHYKYPFIIPVPANSPPSSSFGSQSGALKRLKGNRVSVLVDHRVDVNVYIANSLMDKQSTYTVPMVVKCTSPSLLLTDKNGREGHLRKGMSTTFSTRGSLIRAVFGNALSSKTHEQADCDLYVYNTSISLAETPFLHFAIRGNINCPYYISLIRVTCYGSGVTAQKGTEEVVSRIMMPPLDSPTQGVKSKLVISPHALQSSTSFQGRFVACQFFVTLDLIYTSGVDAGFLEEHKMRIPIDVSHGSLAEEAVVGEVASTILDGAVMAYSCPDGHAGNFIPIAPVTEGNVAPAAWGGTELRYNRQVANDAKVQTVVNNNDKNAFSASAAAGGNGTVQYPPTAACLYGSPSDSVMERGLNGAQPHFVSPVSGYVVGNPNNTLGAAPVVGAFAPPSTTYPAHVNYTAASPSSSGSPYGPKGGSACDDQQLLGGSRRSDTINSEDAFMPSAHGPIYDENGRPIHTSTPSRSSGSSSLQSSANKNTDQQHVASSKTAAPLPPQ